jgi:hypothetical protein
VIITDQIFQPLHEFVEFENLELLQQLEKVVFDLVVFEVVIRVCVECIGRRMRVGNDRIVHAAVAVVRIFEVKISGENDL